MPYFGYSNWMLNRDPLLNERIHNQICFLIEVHSNLILSFSKHEKTNERIKVDDPNPCITTSHCPSTKPLSGGL